MTPNPMALSNKDRQKALRKRRHKDGIVRVECWVSKRDVQAFRAYVAKFKKQN